MKPLIKEPTLKINSESNPYVKLFLGEPWTEKKTFVIRLYIHNTIYVAMPIIALTQLSNRRYELFSSQLFTRDLVYCALVRDIASVSSSGGL